MLYQDYAEIFEDLAHGEPKCRGIRFAIDKALERQDFENALILYFDYVEEDYFYGDGFQAAILFPEYVSCFDSHPELHEKYSYNFMWAFKWALSCFESFYQMFDLLSFTLSYPVRRACALFSKPACALKKA